MSAETWFLPLVVVLVGAAFNYLFRLQDVADSIRRALVDAKLWSPSSFPESIAKIEENPRWASCVRAYYMDIQRIYHLIMVNLAVLIAILIGCVSIYVYAPSLGAITLRQGVSALTFMQTLTIIAAVGDLFQIVRQVNDRAKFKGHVDTIIAATR